MGNSLLPMEGKTEVTSQCPSCHDEPTVLESGIMNDVGTDSMTEADMKNEGGSKYFYSA